MSNFLKIPKENFKFLKRNLQPNSLSLVWKDELILLNKSRITSIFSEVKNSSDNFNGGMISICLVDFTYTFMFNENQEIQFKNLLDYIDLEMV